ncbi:hypothetical protein NPIL_335431 [Nephila pilipes]|uniref:Uncharacterized protein n=1 Tax=Nephila pilipes TaxID=299642 RepID=A0A8X6Q3H9_NEPPI|nr:hypothetical protein NPIL_335431 [Nephila pilipes]
MSGLLHDSSRWITSFNSNRLVGLDRYTWDFKYRYSPKSAGVRYEDRGGHGNLQRLLMILYNPTKSNVPAKMFCQLATRIVLPVRYYGSDGLHMENFGLK